MTKTWDSDPQDSDPQDNDPQLASDNDVTVYQVPGTDVQYAGADTDGDGLEDTWAYDYNGDGTPEAYGADGGHDGAPDAWVVSDGSGDGAVYYADTNGNNLPDPWETVGYEGNPHNLEPASDWMHGY